MASNLSLSGLASGVDTSGIVDKLMAIERQGLTRLSLRQTHIRQRETDLGEFRTKLRALSAAAGELKAPSLWAPTQDVASASAGRLAGSRSGPIEPGVYDVEVQGLAVVEQRTYDFTPPAGAGAIDLGDLSVPLSAGATVSDAAAAINATPGAPVTAAVVDGRLQLTSRTSGAAGGFTASGANLAQHTERLGADARFTVDGIPGTSSSNVIENAVPGLRLSLKAVTAPGEPVQVTVGEPRQELDRIREKVRGFVTAYNAVVDFVQRESTERKVRNPASSLDAGKGALFADRELIAARNSLRSAVSDVVAGNPQALDQLSELGITTGKTSGTGASSENSKLGRLVLDEARLTAALETDPAGVQRLLGGATGVAGFAQRIEGIVDTHVGSLIPDRLKASASELKRLSEQMQRADDRLAAKEKRLRAQFAAMETALGASQTQGTWLSGQLAALQPRTS